jgi:hypothetical protein
MGNPTKYTPGYSYSGFQGANPTKPLPAPRVDDDFANISRSINEAIVALADIRRSDGRLQNGSVGPDTLSPILKIGFTFRGLWIQGEKYVAGDGVVHEGVFYSASRANTATEQNAPGDASYWAELFSVDDLVVSGALSMPVNRFTGDGSATEFDLDFTPVTAKNLLITIGGAPQETTQYGTVGNKLTFNEPPPEGYSIEVRGFATLAVSDTIVSDTVIEGEQNLFLTPAERENLRRLWVGASGVSPAEFGGVGDGLADDSLAVVAACLAAKNRNTYVNFGELKYWKVRKQVWPAINGEAVTGVFPVNEKSLYGFGKQSKILFEGETRADYATMFPCFNGAGVYLRGVGYDYVNLPFAQGVCIAKSATTADFRMDLSIQGQEPTFTEIQRLAIYTKRRRLRVKVVLEEDGGYRAFTKIAPGIWRVNFGAETAALAMLTAEAANQQGDTCVMYHTVNGFSFIDCTNGWINIDDAELNTTAGMMLCGSKLASAYVGTETYLRPRVGSKRIISSLKDGINFQGIEQEAPFICPGVVEGTSDDAANVGMPTNFVYKAVPGAPYNTDAYDTFLSGGTRELGVVALNDEVYAIAPSGAHVSLGYIKAISFAAPASQNTPAITLDTPLPNWLVGSLDNADPTKVTKYGIGRFLPKRGIVAPGLVQACVRGVFVRGEGMLIRGDYNQVYGPAVQSLVSWGTDGEGVAPHQLDIDVRINNCGRAVNSVKGALIVFAAKSDATDYAPGGTIQGGRIRARIENCPGKAYFISSVEGMSIDITERNNNYAPWLADEQPYSVGLLKYAIDCDISHKHQGATLVNIHVDAGVRNKMAADNIGVTYSGTGFEVLANFVSEWNGGRHLQIGNHHFWGDGYTSVRHKFGAPASEYDGQALTEWVLPPGAPNSPGRVGHVSMDANYFYWATGINTWARVAKSAW